MSGIPAYNYPAFDEAARVLRAAGFEVVTPSELDDPETRAKALASPDGKDNTGHTWGEFLARDVKIVADDVNAVALLPGWENSRGAKLEAYVGLCCGHRFYEYLSDEMMVYISPQEVQRRLF